MAENTKDAFNDWICQRISYLPGETWPEAWIVQKCAEAPEALAAILSLEVDELQEILEYGLQAGKHNEFYEIAKHVGLDRTQCLQSLTTAICTAFPSEFVEVVKAIEVALK